MKLVEQIIRNSATSGEESPEPGNHTDPVTAIWLHDERSGKRLGGVRLNGNARIVDFRGTSVEQCCWAVESWIEADRFSDWEAYCALAGQLQVPLWRAAQKIVELHLAQLSPPGPAE